MLDCKVMGGEDSPLRESGSVGPAGLEFTRKSVRSSRATPVSGQAAVATFGKANTCWPCLAMAFGIYYPYNRKPVIKDIDTEGDMTEVPSGMFSCLGETIANSLLWYLS